MRKKLKLNKKTQLKFLSLKKRYFKFLLDFQKRLRNMNPQSIPIDSSDEENVTTTRRRVQGRRGGGSAASTVEVPTSAFPDARPLEEADDGGDECSGSAAFRSSKRNMSKVTEGGEGTTTRKSSKKKHQSKRNLDEIQTFEEVYEKITEALNKTGNESSNTKAVADLMLARSVEMLTVTASTTKPSSKRFTPAEAYDVFGSFILESQGATDEKMTNTFFTKYATNVKRQTASSPYDALGFVFSSPLFEEQRIQDVRDVNRRRTGPAMRKGVVKCRKCKSKYTDSRPKQDRSGDEPMSFLHDCRVCGEHWKTSG
jgi:DNA-directed RNA polymerase subunit M/transcription elongation factor TFIIS